MRVCLQGFGERPRDGDSLCVFVCRVVENGRETVTVEENGVLKSKLVNGQEMAIEAGSSGGRSDSALRHK